MRLVKSKSFVEVFEQSRAQSHLRPTLDPCV